MIIHILNILYANIAEHIGINIFQGEHTRMTINLYYIIPAAVVVLLLIGAIVGLVIALRLLKKASGKATEAEKAEAVNEIETVLKSLIVGTEGKFKDFAAFLATRGAKAGEVKKDVVMAKAKEYKDQNGLDISNEQISEMVDSLVEFMNKKTPALPENNDGETPPTE